MRNKSVSVWILRLCLALVLATIQTGRVTWVTHVAGQGISYGPNVPPSPGEFQETALAPQMVGQVGGRTEDVAVQGDYAYVAVGLRLVVLDVSDPATPTEIGSTPPFPEFVEGVAVSGTLAYVADGMTGLRVVDISEPTDPVEVGVYDTPGYAEGVVVSGTHAYVADGHYGLRIVDVSDPVHPSEVAYAYPLHYVFDVALDGQYAYLAAAGAGLLVVDVSDPANPVETGTHDTPGYAYGVDVAGGIAYVGDGWEGLRVVVVSDPAHPAEAGFDNTPGWAFGVTVSGTVAYVADAFAGLQVVDVADPAHPGGLGGEEVSRGHAGRVVVVSDTAYVADRNRGLRVVAVSDPGAPTQVGFYGPLVVATAAAVSGDYAYVGAATYGLRVVDISDPVHPVEVGAYDTQAHVVGVAVDGNYAYVSAAFGEPGTGLHVVDVSNPAHPTGVGFCEPVGIPRDIAVAGGIAYIADEWGLQLIDVSFPHMPTHVGRVILQGEEWAATTGVAVSGTLAYVAQDSQGMRIVDVSNPVSPTLMSTFKDPEWVKGFGVAVAGTRAYVTHHGGDGLKIIDVSDPLHPALLGGYRGPSLPERLTVVSNTAYVAFGNSGLLGIDATDPTSPALAFAYDTPGYAIAPAIVGNHTYVADGPGGLLILGIGGGQSAVSGQVWTVPDSAGSNRFPMPRHSERVSLLQRGRDGVGEQGRPAPGHPLSTLSSPVVHRIATTCMVTSTADSGPGTLRACLDNAVSGDTILFDPVVFPPGDPATITLSSGLWVGQGNITLDGSNAGVILDGSQQDGSLTLASDGNVVKGLHIVNCSWAGVHICCGAKHNVIGGDRSRGDGPTGEGNVISGNGVTGLVMNDTGTMYNVVVGNLIGTDAMGTSALPNTWDGVDIQNGASFNRIGGPEAWERNIISGNKNAGVVISSYIGHTIGNKVIGNFIGTDVSGTSDLGNGWTGVSLELGAFNNTVKDNLVSGSNWGGIAGDVGTSYNAIIGNLVGTDASGTQALGNRWAGIALGESFNRVGGTAPGDRNTIGGNPQGIALAGEHNLVLGNSIGTNISGTESIGNSQGIFITGSSNHNFVGGTTPAERNIISGNGSEGVVVGGTGPNLFLGNYVGTDASGTAALGNQWSGIALDATQYSVIQGNLIGGNEETGISISNGSDFTHLRANRIGVAADGVSPLPNGSDGVSISAASNTVGGPYPQDGNVIAFNGGDGVQIWTYPGNTIRRNSIYGNAGAGILLPNGGNDSLAAPAVIGVGAGSVSGTACPGCVVEIFSDEEDEGRVCEGHTVADGEGDWEWVGSVHGPYVTATATDGAGSTSAFSAAQLALFERVYLPLLTRNSN
jgi:hypothetical protein